MAFSIDRRELMLGAGAAALVAAAGGLALPDAAAQVVPGQRPSRMRHDYRRRGRACFDYRLDAAKLARRRNRPMLFPENNGEEDQFPDRRWNYSKGLQHDALGHVDPGAYDALLHAVTTGAPADFDAIPIAGRRKLVSPQAGLAFDLLLGFGIRPGHQGNVVEGEGALGIPAGTEERAFAKKSSVVKMSTTVCVPSSNGMVTLTLPWTTRWRPLEG